MHWLTVWLQLSRKRRIELDDSEPFPVPQKSKRLRKTKSSQPHKADEIQETQQGGFEAQWLSDTVALDESDVDLTD